MVVASGFSAKKVRTLPTFSAIRKNIIKIPRTVYNVAAKAFLNVLFGRGLGSMLLPL